MNFLTHTYYLIFYVQTTFHMANRKLMHGENKMKEQKGTFKCKIFSKLMNKLTFIELFRLEFSKFVVVET